MVRGSLRNVSSRTPTLFEFIACSYRSKAAFTSATTSGRSISIPALGTVGSWAETGAVPARMRRMEAMYAILIMPSRSGCTTRDYQCHSWPDRWVAALVPRAQRPKQASYQLGSPRHRRPACREFRTDATPESDERRSGLIPRSPQMLWPLGHYLEKS